MRRHKRSPEKLAAQVIGWERGGSSGRWPGCGGGPASCAASNPAIASRLQSDALVGRVAELGSLGGTTRIS